jgi:hypothetical protein
MRARSPSHNTPTTSFLPPASTTPPKKAYEILELFLELVAVRSALVANSREIPRDMVEALSSVLYAATRRAAPRAARAAPRHPALPAGPALPWQRRARRLPASPGIAWLSWRPPAAYEARGPRAEPTADLCAHPHSHPPRVPDLPELVTLHKIFAVKFGKEYVEQASSDVHYHR